MANTTNALGSASFGPQRLSRLNPLVPITIAPTQEDRLGFSRLVHVFLTADR